VRHFLQPCSSVEATEPGAWERHGGRSHAEHGNEGKIFEYSNDAIFVIDPRGGRILEANPTASELLG
jgi:PAS domain-containing protein